MRTVHKVLIVMFIIAGIVSYNLGILEEVIKVPLGVSFAIIILKIWFRKPKTVKEPEDNTAMILWDKNGKEIFRK
jgi:hypothetical protein